MPGLEAHVAQGLTTLCHAWLITRTDGKVFGFTDHDMKIEFGGVSFLANSGLSALALAQSTGLSVDNTEALGALSAACIREDEIEQGRFDDAQVQAWLVNWANLDERQLQFRGTVGVLTRADNGFRAELRGLTEMLNRPLGRVYQKPCTAVFGDDGCRFNVNQEAYADTLKVRAVKDAREFSWEGYLGYEAGWFTRGRLEVVGGPAAGLWSMIKHDRFDGNTRIIELWEPIRGQIEAGTYVRLIAGCDKRTETCRLKFNNLRNFQGFPDLPSEDWVVSVPRASGANSGGSLR